MISWQRLRRRMRDILGGDDGRGRADDAVELPDAVAPPLRTAVDGGV